MYLYADDTVLLSQDDSITNCKHNMQHDLTIKSNWCRSNKLSVHIKKTKCMLFGSRVRLKNTAYPRLYIANVCIELVLQYKYLGVVMHSHLTFNKHLNNIIKITAYTMNILPKISQYLTETASLTIYKSIILPYFDYGDILLMSSHKKLLDRFN